MVRGLSIFQEWFKDYESHYVLIGGTAAKITMEEAGANFRGTRDLDIVLHVEALTPEFGRHFWEFVMAGNYQQKEGNPSSKPCVYRFQKPSDEDFPLMLELFSRVPDGIAFVPPGHLTPIPFDEQISSLSAILLDDAYYRFVLEGRRSKHGLPSWVGEDRLIPLKALAWVEMTERVGRGEVIDSRKIRKHLEDVLALSGLLQPGQVIEIPERIRIDMRRFLQLANDIVGPGQILMLQRIAAAYALG
jgi:hypothetical protein